MVNAVDMAKRALVKLLKELAVLYSLTVGVTRDSPDPAVRTAYRKVSVKTHPDHGGDADHQRQLELSCCHAVRAKTSSMPSADVDVRRITALRRRCFRCDVTLGVSRLLSGYCARPPGRKSAENPAGGRVDVIITIVIIISTSSSPPPPS